MRTLPHRKVPASMSLLRGLLLPWLRPRLLLLPRLRLRLRRTLLMPLVELLFLLLLLLLGTLLHRRCRTYQRMRLLLSRTILLEVAICRLHPILRSLHILVFVLRIPVLTFRASLLLKHARLALRRLVNLIVAAIGRAERTETILCLLGAPLVHLCGLRRPNRTNQRLFVQTSACLRLPLFDRTRQRWRSPDCNHGTAYHRCGRSNVNRPA